ncbi:MAG: YcxB family protein [Gemmatimonadaceae bacterium]
MQFDVDPQPNENQRACTAIARAVLPTSRSHFIIMAVVFAISIAAILLTPATTAYSATIGIVAVISMIALQDADVKRRLRRAQARDPHAAESFSVEVTDAGVRTWCSHIEVRHSWAAFMQVFVTSEFVLFASPSGSGVALPRRVVSPETLTTLLARIDVWAPDLYITHVGRSSTKSAN